MVEAMVQIAGDMSYSRAFTVGAVIFGILRDSGGSRATDDRSRDIRKAASEWPATSSAMMRMSTHSVPEPVREAAAAAQFGAWEQSLRVRDNLMMAAIGKGTPLLSLVSWAFVLAGIFLPVSWWIRVPCIIFGLVFALAIRLLRVRNAWKKPGPAVGVIHFFRTGAVLERAERPLAALPYDTGTFQYAVPGELLHGSSATKVHPQFWIAPPDGHVVMVDASESWEREALDTLARRLGLPWNRP